MIYLIYGNQSATIKNKIRSIVKNNLIEKDDLNFVNFDGSLTPIQECIDEANYIPLGYDHKIVNIQNAYFLLKSKPKTKIETEQLYDVFVQYLKSPNEDCDLILSVVSLDVDKKSEYFKLIEEKGKIFEIADPDEKQWNSYVRMYCLDKKGLNIDNDALNELAVRTACDVALFQNNVLKLSLYTDHITYDDVCLMVTKPLEENAFLLFNYLIDGRTNDALSLYEDLRTNNVEPVTLISMLANQFRLLGQISFLSSKGFTNDEIALELKIKVIRVKILKRSVSRISLETIDNTLVDLFNLDLKIKNGLVDRFYAFELFLINFKRS